MQRLRQECIETAVPAMQIVIPLGAMTWPQKLYERKMREEREKAQYRRV